MLCKSLPADRERGVDPGLPGQALHGDQYAREIALGPADEIQLVPFPGTLSDIGRRCNRRAQPSEDEGDMLRFLVVAALDDMPIGVVREVDVSTPPKDRQDQP